MEDLIQLSDSHLVYEPHELNNGKLAIHVSSNRVTANCPYCGKESSRVHSLYTENFQDLPVQGNKVTIYMLNKKFFCINPDYTHKTFSERFGCISDKAKKQEGRNRKIFLLPFIAVPILLLSF